MEGDGNKESRGAGKGLQLSREQARKIVDHLRAEYPNEACGLLGGRGGKVEGVYPLPNARPNPNVYEAEPAALLEAMLEMERQGWEPVPMAIYHSHPHSAAYPSPTDVRLAYYPESMYVIVSLREWEQPSMHAFRIVDGQVLEESLILEG